MSTPQLCHQHSPIYSQVSFHIFLSKSCSSLLHQVLKVAFISQACLGVTTAEKNFNMKIPTTPTTKDHLFFSLLIAVFQLKMKNLKDLNVIDPSLLSFIFLLSLSEDKDTQQELHLGCNGIFARF